MAINVPSEISQTAKTNASALITGASRGFGLALARQLAKQGWTLVLDARHADALEQVRVELALFTKVIAISGDVTNAAHRAELLNVVKSIGGVDTIVNNASTLGVSPRPNLLDYPLDELATVYQTNVIAPLALIQTLRYALKPNARIINITSDAGVEPYAGWGGYGSSKAALEHLSAILANEQPDWRVYWVDPGDMQTQMHQEAFPGEDISDRDLPEASVPGLLTLLQSDLPSGRYQAKKISARPDQDANPPKSHVQQMRVVLTVSDFAKARHFYEDGLGLQVTDQWIGPDSKGVLFDAGSATLEVVNEAQAHEVDQIEVGQRSAGQVRLAFVVDQVNDASAALQEQNAKLLSEAILTPWKHLNQRLLAPGGIQDGIQLTLSQIMEVETEGEES